MDVLALHAICITWKLIQIKLLTEGFCQCVCLCLSFSLFDIPLLFGLCHLPPKQITSKIIERKNFYTKSIFGLKRQKFYLLCVYSVSIFCFSASFCFLDMTFSYTVENGKGGFMLFAFPHIDEVDFQMHSYFIYNG